MKIVWSREKCGEDRVMMLVPVPYTRVAGEEEVESRVKG